MPAVLPPTERGPRALCRAASDVPQQAGAGGGLSVHTLTLPSSSPSERSAPALPLPDDVQA